MNSWVSSLFPNQMIWTWIRTTKSFFDTRDSTRSSSTSPDASGRGGARSSDFDMEEDPMGPDNPEQTSRTTFEVGKGGLLMISVGRKVLILATRMMMMMMMMTTTTGWTRLSPHRCRPRSKRLRWSRTHSNNFSSHSGSGVKVKSKKKKTQQSGNLPLSCLF
ncbi:hypothetical protein PILCRDRAFT_711129 [Piloderma croceum F 1598]|uniref:Uncharacterized protein n=1 Tax=Piloderma croceum (strain F 1598) TaxID=765440 RepID=A0A0C3AK09_PILCF|nr:hypothetical protein PILCRDRAFT_711129 [Piloderma croceum F 1598]